MQNIPKLQFFNGKKQNKKPSRHMHVLRFMVYWFCVVIVWITIICMGLFAFYGAKLPQSSSWVIPERAPNIRVNATDGTFIANRGVMGGVFIPINDISPLLIQAVISIEDRRFKSHFGIDPIGLMRAFFVNLSVGKVVQGGSTLTQQLAKNLFLKPERTLERKIQEIILALWLEANYSKNDILEMYLNRVYFGFGAYGIDAASRRYFMKSAKELNIAEAALLAGLLKAPSRLSPTNDIDFSRQRSQLVLKAMKQARFISDNDIITALSLLSGRIEQFNIGGSENYVADYVVRELRKLIGKIDKDVIVETTIEPSMQKYAEETILSILEKHNVSDNVSQGALICLDNKGAIRALIGGREYTKSQFNRATEAKRQPGSSFKPFVYLAALKEGYTPDTVLIDKPTRVGNWKPKNYNRKYQGRVTLNYAFANSINTIAVQLAAKIGIKKIIQTAKQMGIKSKLGYNSSIALGTSEVSLLELTNSYVPFSNGGYRTVPHIIKRVTALDGELLYLNPAIKPKKVVRQRELKMMNTMLEEVVRSGSGKYANIQNKTVKGKTGTTQNFRDGWFIGYTDNLVTGVWFGNDDGSPTYKITGGSVPVYAWKLYMHGIHALQPEPILGSTLPFLVINPIPHLRKNRFKKFINKYYSK